MIDTFLRSISLFFGFPGSWHFDIGAARFFDELLQEHDDLALVVTVDILHDRR